MALSISTNVQRVIVDRDTTSDEAFNRASGVGIPPIIPENNGYTGIGLPFGFARYTTTNSVTGVAQTLNMTVSKPHRLMRIEYQQIVTSTGAPDMTGLAVELARLNRIKGSGAVDLLSQPNAAESDVILLFGDGWEADAATYQHIWTGQNNDTLTIDVIIQYL